MSVPIVDTHNDLLLELDHRRDEETPFASHWLPNLEQGGVILQVCPIFGAEPEWLPERSLRQTLQQINAFHRAARECADRVTVVERAADLDAVEQGQRLGLMLSMEGVEALGYDPAMIDVFWKLGVRMASLTWNRRNPFADGAAEPPSGGLSRLGQVLIDRLAELGAIIDLAHASEQTFRDVLGRTEQTALVVSHAACRAVCDTPRNLSDDQLRALAERDGVLGIMLLPFVIDPQNLQIARAVDHIDHAVSVMGIEHVGLGGDFIRQVQQELNLTPPADSLLPPGLSWESAIEGLSGPEGYPRLVEALHERGYDDDALRAVAGGNFLRLFRSALPG